MRISLHNYEAFFLDYIEGKMSPAEVAELMAFLANNPDLKAELNNYDAITLAPSANIFIEKDFLKKNVIDIISINEYNFNELCIALLEGDLDTDTENLFEKYLQQNPEKLKEYKQYLKTILEPDKTIVFNEKRKLKHYKLVKHNGSVFAFVAVAASLLLFIMAYNILKNNNLKNQKIAATLSLETASKLTLKKENQERENPATHNAYKVQAKIQKHNVQGTLMKEDPKPLKKVEVATLELQKSIILYELETSEFKFKPTLANINMSLQTLPETKIVQNNDTYLSINEIAAKEFNKLIEKQDIIDKDGINLWALAKSSVNQLNRITGTSIDLEKSTDTTNNRTRVEFSTGLLGFYSSKNE